MRFDEEVKRQLAENAAKVAEELHTRYPLSQGEAANLTKVSLFDIFFLCGKFLFHTFRYPQIYIYLMPPFRNRNILI
jgi:hypothetical protein